MNILVTGGAGYIGSHVVKILLNQGHQVVTLDNLQKGYKEAVTGGKFIEADLADQKLLNEIMQKNEIEAVIHLAADSLVGESMEKPGKYYRNNFANGINLLEAMVKNEVKNIVFSSTAAVYGEPDEIPIKENNKTEPTSTYGESKLFFEKALRRYDDVYGIKYTSLRYFNAAGADPEAKIGEAHDPETHLIPIVLQTALGIRDKIYIFGDDYSTRDGSCIRDYIHVSDLAAAHLLAVEALASGRESAVYNLGNGEGYSVKEVIKTVKEITGKDFEVEVSDRRAGDPAVLIASSEKIQKELDWQPEFPELEKIISTAWQWHKSGGFGE
ncbi:MULTISPECIES: UDP-glucose 4-epimerase GalE [Halanaerobium]|jgi:UDP-glucose 4-epimerase|uniref:UDP-glucose 4-epimerase n=1 Tax=Halanaerobium congolense TaxID=54121 RepID=A0A1M7NSB4_9FIRM|nr:MULTISPECIES: UDP-glucose 4-epimerase GalE [Halanaerobium]KXS48600.1 MAG: UDP-glucose 4-epimerase [Halanaerobium sp. T82-1]OEG62944.1 MAG: UDP-glucose 4-epimerase GalE [Halanaerobium sp. MDAL1]PTX17626.1 UDP-galactose 4-epimerase [Halanaerobium congolense]PUU88160.1 MAG: UDP-glucose 4-epimerase [Halanaerobium sp.]PUU90279.1 MAG: UDP-glucose 4-epimerase [Halanaerobium sp.]